MHILSTPHTVDTPNILMCTYMTPTHVDFLVMYTCPCRYVLIWWKTTLLLSQWVGHCLMKWVWPYKHYGVTKACRRQLNDQMSSS